MGQKVDPRGFRVGIVRACDSVWYAGSCSFPVFLLQDYKLRCVLKRKLKKAGVSKIVIERPHKKCHVTIHTTRPGYVIGKKGEDIEKLKEVVRAIVDCEVHINIVEVRNPEIDATLIAENIAQSLERRVPPRRLMRKAVQSAMRSGALGVRVSCAGRLGGSEIARREEQYEGSIPLHKLRADIDYALAEAKTTYGVCSVKVWVYKGDIMKFPSSSSRGLRQEAPPSDSGGPRSRSPSAAAA